MDHSDCLVGGWQLQRADMLSLRYEKIVTCMTDCRLLSYHYFTYTAAQFSLSTVTVSAESVAVGTDSMNRSTHGARVTWSTEIPPECVASVTVEFRTESRGPVVATISTTTRSQTELIQTGLQRAINYYYTLIVTGDISGGVRPTLRSRQEQVCVGGKHNKIVFYT